MYSLRGLRNLQRNIVVRRMCFCWRMLRLLIYIFITERICGQSLLRISNVMIRTLLNIDFVIVTLSNVMPVAVVMDAQILLEVY